MVRLGSLPLVLGFLSACTGDIISDNLEGLSPEEQVAREKWVDKALPVFTAKCTTGCHDGTRPNIGYIAGTDDLMKRDTLVNYAPQVVNLGAPMSSRVLTKGDHTAAGGGPALLAPEASDILSWIVAERDARPETPPIRTEPSLLQICTSGNPGDATCPINTVDLSGLGVAGASVSFVMQAVGTDLYFTQLKVKAGAEGLYLEHPQFETTPAGATEPVPDPVDQFFAVMLNLAPNAEAPLGNGTATIAGFSANDALSIRVFAIEKQRPGT